MTTPTREHESKAILEDFVRVMDECGSWPDEEADMIRLAEVAHRARCHLKGIPDRRTCPRPLPTKDGVDISRGNIDSDAYRAIVRDVVKGGAA